MANPRPCLGSGQSEHSRTLKPTPINQWKTTPISLLGSCGRMVARDGQGVLPATVPGHGHKSVKTIFITGATGLVGSHAVEEALKRGHHVRALVRPTSDTRLLKEWGVQTVLGDLEDAAALKAGARAPTGSSTAPPRSATGERSKNSVA